MEILNCARIKQRNYGLPEGPDVLLLKKVIISRLTAVIVPFFGPMTAFWPVFAVIVPLSGPMTALGQQFV